MIKPRNSKRLVKKKSDSVVKIVAFAKSEAVSKYLKK